MTAQFYSQRNWTRTGVLSAVAAFTIVAAPPISAEEDDKVVTSFCENSAQCSTVKLANGASATVININVTQQDGAAACTTDKRKIKRNLSGDVSKVADGQSVKVSFNENCDYKIKFNTTSGCTGDKVGHIRADDYGDLQKVNLKGGCGSLKVKKVY